MQLLASVLLGWPKGIWGCGFGVCGSSTGQGEGKYPTEHPPCSPWVRGMSPAHEVGFAWKPGPSQPLVLGPSISQGKQKLTPLLPAARMPQVDTWQECGEKGIGPMHPRSTSLSWPASLGLAHPGHGHVADGISAMFGA